MMKQYKKSIKKVNALLITMLVMMTLGTIIYSYLLFDIKHGLTNYIIGITFILLFTFGTIIPNIVNMYKHKFMIDYRNNLFIFYDTNKDVIICVEEIKSIKYSGNKLIPMSEMMIIKTDSQVIYIDFNFEQYLEIWKEIILLIQRNNSKIVISPRLLKRLKIKTIRMGTSE